MSVGIGSCSSKGSHKRGSDGSQQDGGVSNMNSVSSHRGPWSATHAQIFYSSLRVNTVKVKERQTHIQVLAKSYTSHKKLCRQRTR